MFDFIGGGKIVAANPSGLDIVNFDPRRDSLDFGDISVHGLILGSRRISPAYPAGQPGGDLCTCRSGTSPEIYFSDS